MKEKIIERENGMDFPEKMFYKIGEVSELLEVKSFVIRYWESEFKQLRPTKNGTGQRVYRKKDLLLLKRIKELLYDELYTIPGAKKRLEKDRQEAKIVKVVDNESSKVREKLQSHRNKLIEIKHFLENNPG